MTARAINNRRYEEQEIGSNVPVKILAAVGLFGLAILMIYICLASPQAGTSMGAIKSVLVGLGGNIAVMIPLVLVWAGVLCIGAAKGMKINPVRVAADALLILCLFTAVHMFFIGTIIDHRQMKNEYFNIGGLAGLSPPPDLRRGRGLLRYIADGCAAADRHGPHGTAGALRGQQGSRTPPGKTRT